METGNVVDGLEMMRECFREDPHRSEWHWNWEFHAALMAEALGLAGETAEGHRWLDRAQSYTRDGGGRSFEPEIWRTRGDLFVADGVPDEAETNYKKALDIALGHDSKSLELRAAMRLARLWHSQGKTVEARKLLAPVYDWFTEGFDTAT